MKILKEGKTIPKEKEQKIIGYDVICKKCDCHFQIFKNEIKYHTLQGGFQEATWDCPWCGTHHETWYCIGMTQYEAIYEEV